MTNIFAELIKVTKKPSGSGGAANPKRLLGDAGSDLRGGRPWWSPETASRGWCSWCQIPSPRERKRWDTHVVPGQRCHPRLVWRRNGAFDNKDAQRWLLLPKGRDGARVSRALIEEEAHTWVPLLYFLFWIFTNKSLELKLPHGFCNRILNQIISLDKCLT